MICLIPLIGLGVVIVILILCILWDLIKLFVVVLVLAVILGLLWYFGDVDEMIQVITSVFF
ncbi:MAG: hypothetical protein V5A88_03625 [Candidatus Thermoplasmatota archaeon]